MDSIQDLIPHRPPFLFVDDVNVDEGIIIASHVYKPEDWFFRGHFPEFPVVPGVLLVETLAQAGGAGVKLLGVLHEGIFMLAKIRSATFRRPVRPGEKLNMQIECIKASSHIIHQKGTGKVGDEVAVEAEWINIATIVDESLLKNS